MHNKHIPEDAETAKSIERLARALSLVRTSFDASVSTQLVQAFLTVALNEGKTLTEIAGILGTNISTASRQLLDLGQRNRKMEQGYMLVDRQADPMNLRINRYALTDKGRDLVRELAEVMR